MKCIVCGREAEDGSLFCRECGAENGAQKNSASEPAPEAENAPRSESGIPAENAGKKKLNVRAVAVAAAAVAAVIIAVILIKRFLPSKAESSGGDKSSETVQAAEDNMPSADLTDAGTDGNQVTKEQPEPDTSALPVYEKYGYTRLDYSSPALLAETEPADDEYMDSIVYLCDSTLYHLGMRGFVTWQQIWTGEEMTQTLDYQDTFEILDPYDEVKRPIREVARIHRPERMIICLGTNGISWMSPDDVYDEFCDLIGGIKEASPDTDIILASILPMSPEMHSWSSADFDNGKITACNAKILKAAEDNGIVYLDIFSVLVDPETGMFNTDYNEDGLHPNYEGNSVIIDYIRTHRHG